MDERTIAAIALSNRDYPDLRAKLDEAVAWIELAAAQGCQLAVLPEAVNKYRGDGAGNPHRLTYGEMALDDWRRQTAPLIDAAARCEIAVVIPVITREPQGLTNSFFFIDRRGRCLGRYQKQFPTPEELDAGIVPGPATLIEWEGLHVAGGICFDTCFPEAFDRPASLGADLFVIPSLWPGGSQLNHAARTYATPVVLAYPAWSRIIDSGGRDVAAGGYRNETLRFGFGSPIVAATLNFDRVSLYGNHNQQKMLDVQRRYGAAVRIEFDQANCLFLLESRSPDLTVKEVVAEFGLIDQRTYFEYCRRRVADAVAQAGERAPERASEQASEQREVERAR